jgi:GDP-D-mannose 3', 5'-epimerase
VITGAGGFIGGHLMHRLADQDVEVFALDIKPVHEWWQKPGRLGIHAHQLDVQFPFMFTDMLDNVDTVFHLAEDMGGMGYLADNHLKSLNSIKNSIPLFNILRSGQRIFYASSACVYPEWRQESEFGLTPIAEDEAFPAQPDLGYGWEKLYAELLLREHAKRGVEVRIGRYHNVYGPVGSWRDGREKAPAAICRKVAEAVLTGRHQIEIWGNGEQRRSFMYIRDCLDGTLILTRSDYDQPLNIGSAEQVSINQLVDAVETIAFGEPGHLNRVYIDGPQGVRGRSSDNERIRAVLSWEPQINLMQGLIPTYAWIYDQVKRSMK